MIVLKDQRKRSSSFSTAFLFWALDDPGTADIVSENHRNIMFQSGFGTVDDSLKDNIFIILFDFQQICREQK